MLRDTLPGDTDALIDMTARTGVFYDHEVEMLRMVLDDYHEEEQFNGHVCKTWDDGQIRGIIYYAPVEMTIDTWEVWWIIIDIAAQGQGLGLKMMRHAEEDMRSRGARLLLIETSSLPRYEPTWRFYRKLDYQDVARIPDFYTDGDDKIIFSKRMRPR